MSVVPVLGSTLGQIFHPIFEALAWVIGAFYVLIPNYAIAIALLTIVVMIVTAPLTIKSTRSMTAMQRLAPEMKKLQQKYKGDKQTLNEEMMKLYKEHGVNPAGGCLPLFIQFPIFFILYAIIRGLTYTVKNGHYFRGTDGALHLCTNTAGCSSPQYISHTTKLYASLQSHNGKMPSFGIDLASKMLSHHTFVQALPYAALILVAIGLQYFQMKQLNSRNPQMAQANPQAQMMQRYMPLLFAVIYINIAAGVNIYFIVSSLCRIGIQEGVFRSGMLNKTPARGAAEETLPGRGGTGTGGAPRRRTVMERLADAQKRALEQQAQQRALRAEIEEVTGSRIEGENGSKPKGPSASVPRPTGPRGSGAARRPDGRPARSVPPPGGGNGKTSGDGKTTGNGAPPKPKGAGQARSKDKRDRRAR